MKLIPYSFIRDHASLTWPEALWGHDHQLLDWSGAVELALDRITADTTSVAEIQLAGIDKYRADQVGQLLRQLATSEGQENDESIGEVWQYLRLAWLFEHRTEFADPFEEIELIYADFDYPSNIEGFVRYMPETDPEYDPAQHTAAENEQRMVESWTKYLRDSKYRFFDARH